MVKVKVTGSGIAKGKESGKAVVISAPSLKVAPKSHEPVGKVHVAGGAISSGEKKKVHVATDSPQY